MANSRSSKDSNPPQGTVFRGWRQWLMYSTFLALSVAAAYYMRVVPDHNFGVGDQFTKIIESGKFSQNGIVLRKEYTGISGLDQGLAFLVTAFLPAAAGWDRGFYLQTIHFLVSFFPVVSIWAVESCRKRNEWALISFTFIWALFYQTVGGAVIIPIYYMFYLSTSAKEGYFSASSREVPISRARTLLAALLIGYLLPTILTFLPWPNLEDKQAFVALWQPCPLFVNIIHLILTTMDSISHPRKPAATSPPADVKYLNRIYITCFLVSSFVHIGTVYVSFTSSDPELDLYRAFVPQTSRGYLGLTEALHFIFQVDWWIIFGASMVWCVLAIWDLSLIGRTSLGPLEATVAVALGAVVLGPGAVMSLVWYWREAKMVEIEAKSKAS